MKKQNTTTTPPEVVSYEKSKIQLLFNILNSVNFTGIQQAQAVLPQALRQTFPRSYSCDNR